MHDPNLPYTLPDDIDDTPDVGFLRPLLEQIDESCAIASTNGATPKAIQIARKLLIWQDACANVRIEGIQIGFRELAEAMANGSPTDQEPFKWANNCVNAALIAQRIATGIDPSLTAPGTILRLHQEIMKGDDTTAGHFVSESPAAIMHRSEQGMETIIHTGTSPAAVRDQLDRLSDAASKWTCHPMATAAMYHFHFECIHPHGDGNGRLGRILLAAMPTREGYPMLPISVPLDTTDRYKASMGLAQRRPDEMTAYLMIILAAQIDAANHLDRVVKAIQLFIDQAAGAAVSKVNAGAAQHIAEAIAAGPINGVHKISKDGGIDAARSIAAIQAIAAANLIERDGDLISVPQLLRTIRQFERNKAAT